MTANELSLLSSIVAIVAIVAGYLGVRASNRNQLQLAREAYQRDRLTETYLNILRAVCQYTDILDRSEDTSSSEVFESAEFGSPLNEDVEFGAKLLAYASPRVEELWNKFLLLTIRVGGRIDYLRELHGVPLRNITASTHMDRLNEPYREWWRIRDELKEQIRKELQNPGKADESRYMPHHIATKLGYSTRGLMRT
jgi:hypothetical protein